jgi:hypothetical protein
MPDSTPATKGDLEDVRAEMRGMEERLVEAIRDNQTEILRAFYGFTQSVQQRFKEADDTESSLRKRMTILESRLLEVERRLNMPPAA